MVNVADSAGWRRCRNVVESCRRRSRSGPCICEIRSPTSVDEAQALLGSEPGAQVFAGATDMIPQVRAGLPEPPLAIDLKRIPRLVDIRLDSDTWVVGAATPAVRLAEEAGFVEDFPGLAEAAGLIGSDQIQSRASLGGNLCNASPAADTVPAMVVNDMVAVVATNNGERTVPVSDVVTGPGSTSLDGGEFVIEFRLAGLRTAPRMPTSDSYLGRRWTSRWSAPGPV